MAGLLDYNFIWHVGDRLTVLSDGIFDFFDEGQKIVTWACSSPARRAGRSISGFRLLQGPIDSEVMTMTYSYWMSPKWITTTGCRSTCTTCRTSRPRFQLIRVGESMLVGMNLSYDPARRRPASLSRVEPRFITKGGHLANRRASTFRRRERMAWSDP